MSPDLICRIQPGVFTRCNGSETRSHGILMRFHRDLQIQSYLHGFQRCEQTFCLLADSTGVKYDPFRNSRSAFCKYHNFGIFPASIVRRISKTHAQSEFQFAFIPSKSGNLPSPVMEIRPCAPQGRQIAPSSTRRWRRVRLDDFPEGFATPVVGQRARQGVMV